VHRPSVRWAAGAREGWEYASVLYDVIDYCRLGMWPMAHREHTWQGGYRRTSNNDSGMRGVLSRPPAETPSLSALHDAPHEPLFRRLSVSACDEETKSDRWMRGR